MDMEMFGFGFENYASCAWLSGWTILSSSSITLGALTWALALVRSWCHKKLSEWFYLKAVERFKGSKKLDCCQKKLWQPIAQGKAMEYGGSMQKTWSASWNRQTETQSKMLTPFSFFAPSFQFERRTFASFLELRRKLIIKFPITLRFQNSNQGSVCSNLH